jgi:SAM-dependent methyltransferase
MGDQQSTQEPKPVGMLATAAPWNLVAEGYDQITRRFLEAYSRSGVGMLRIRPGMRVVDVACGPGTTSLLLAPRVEAVTALDFSAQMLDRFRANIAAAGARNVEVVEGDGQALPFADASFDIGVSMFGLMFFPDRAKGFSELHRVLVPGGQVLVSSWAPGDQSPLMQALFVAMQPEDAPAAQPPSQVRLSGLEDRALFEAELRQAGFADIRIEAVAHGLPVENIERFWQDTVRGTAPITMWKHSTGAEEWQAIERCAIERLHRMLGDRLPVTLNSTAYLATAMKP